MLGAAIFIVLLAGDTLDNHMVTAATIRTAPGEVAPLADLGRACGRDDSFRAPHLRVKIRISVYWSVVGLPPRIPKTSASRHDAWIRGRCRFPEQRSGDSGGKKRAASRTIMTWCRLADPAGAGRRRWHIFAMGAKAITSRHEDLGPTCPILLG